MEIREVVQHPHDALFKRTMVDKDVALDFIENYIPEEIKSKMDLSKLSIAKDSFIKKELKEKLSDILYQVKIDDREVYIYLLFEHKSYYDVLAPVQLLGYLTDIWDLHWKQFRGKKLPVILPILLYHGDKKWDKGNRLLNILQQPPEGFQKFVPDYKFLFYDFSGLTDEEIKGNIKLKIYSYLVSKLFSEDFYTVLDNVLPLLLELNRQKTGMDYIITVLTYIMSVYKEVSTIEELKKEIGKVSKEGRDMVMTLAEKLLEEGKKEELIDTINIQLEKKFNKKIPEDIKEKIKKSDKKQLVKIRDNIFDIENLDEVRLIIGSK